MNSKILVEKYWAVCISRNREDIKLEFLNSRLRFVDLFSDMVAPLVISTLVEKNSSKVGIIFVAAISFVSIFIEMGLLIRIYNHTPTLHDRNQTDHQTLNYPTIKHRLIYLLKNPVTITCISVSFLYLTVLTINTVMISYLVYQGNSPTYISCLRLISVLCGISATFTLEKLINMFSIKKVGLFSILFQSGCLSVVIASLYVHDLRLSSSLFLVGVCLSRWGLWSFDLVQQQLIQENVPENELQFVSGLEVSLQSLFQLVAYSLTIYWSEPQDFWLPCHVSFISVLCGACTYFYYYIKTVKPYEESDALLSDQVNNT
jgi:iron-regulated transporter 1